MRDSEMHYTFIVLFTTYFTTTISRIESCLDDITNWMTTNRLKLNTDKTELLFRYSKFRPPRPTATFY